MNQYSLTEDGIVLLSGGFEGPFILQAFSIKKISPPHAGLDLCLTDGKIYIGGRYKGADYPEIQPYWLIEITAKCISQTQPITIKSMKVISTFPRKLLGSDHCTLVDYFMRETNQRYQQKQEKISQPSKKVKYSNDAPIKSQKFNQKNTTQKQKLKSTWFPVEKNDQNKFQPQSQSQPKPKQQKIQSQLQVHTQNPKIKKEQIKKLKIQESDENNSQQQKQSTPPQKIIQKSSKLTQKQQQNSQKNYLIQDLKQQQKQWFLICKINCINIIECNNGIQATNFIAIDENGSEIKCVYFNNPNQIGNQIKLEQNKYYKFSKGQIKNVFTNFSNNNSSVRQLQINFDKNSQIVLMNNIQFNENINICKIRQISQKRQNQQVNIIGVVKNIKYINQQSKNKCKFHVFLCDPIQLVQIQIPLFMNNQQETPKIGNLCIFHNYTVHFNKNHYKLNSNYKSYVKQVNNFDDNLFLALRKAKQTTNWGQKNYKNLSSPPFVPKNILQVKNIIFNENDQKFYSLVDCFVFEIHKKNYYHACKNCKKSTEKLNCNVFYCSQCHKNVETFNCHTFSVILSDFTSSISVDVIGEHAQNLLEMKSSNFQGLSQIKQKVYLNEIRMKNVTVKLKSERKDSSYKRETHSIWGIEYFSISNTLQKIKLILQNKKTNKILF